MLDKLQHLWKRYRWNKEDSFGWKAKCLEESVANDALLYSEQHKVLALREGSTLHVYALGKTPDNQSVVVSIRCEHYADDMGSNNIRTTLYPPFAKLPNLDVHMPVAFQAMTEVYFNPAQFKNPITDKTLRDWILASANNPAADPVPALVNMLEALHQISHPALQELNNIKDLCANPKDSTYTQWRQTIEGLHAAQHAPTAVNLPEELGIAT